MKNVLLLSLGLGVAVAAAAQETQTASPSPASPRPTAAASPAAQPVIVPAGEMKWVDEAAVPGSKTAVLWGDPQKEAFGKLNRWKAGTEVPLHWHTFETRSLVVEGTMTVSVDGGPVRELPAGSYFHMPGKVKHVTTCKPGADCVFLTTSRLRFETKSAR